ncbi:hypothetical protein Syun_025556 [Stephania yunnanensis]|uniref:Uncharacterized protein n=1 Tax=Stephania yunnanensis TaxID=152371 RepID=A0AAP0ERW0_9MAGN
MTSPVSKFSKEGYTIFNKKANKATRHASMLSGNINSLFHECRTIQKIQAAYNDSNTT